MVEPSLHYVDCPDGATGHRMAYWQWGDADATHTIVCVHGLTRQGRDFDVLARALLQRAQHPLRIVCPDVAGRGESDRLADPAAYGVPTYAADMLVLLGVLKPQVLDWVGTSLGGLVGMAICGHPAAMERTPVRRLVLNDVGPQLQWQALLRIGEYVGKRMHFASLEEAAAALREVSAGFGPHSEQQWLDLSRPMVRPDATGGVRLHYDPAIAQAFNGMTQESSEQGELVLWSLYDAITATTLVLRGAQSDLLSAATAQCMSERGPHAQVVEFAGVGHAPMLNAQDQIDTVAGFLLNGMEPPAAQC